MQNIHIRKVLKRGGTLLLLFALLLTALPRGAKAEDVTITSGEGGVASFLPGNGDRTYFTIIATPHSNYVFDYWETTCAADASYNNLRFFGSQLTMPYARSNGSVVNVTFEANFRLKNEPVYGVSVQVESTEADRGVVSGGKQATDDHTEVTTTITATPNEDYEFVYWTYWLNDYTQKRFYEQSMQVTASVGYHVIYTAHFDSVDNARGVFTAVAGINANGTRTDNLGGTAVGDAVFRKSGVAAQQTALQAIPATNGYAFSHWEWKRDDETKPTKFTANPLPVTVENHRDVYTAVFVAQSKASGVFVESGYYENSTWTSGGGIATGAKLYDPAGGVGQQTTLQAFPVSTEWVFQKWEKSNATGWEAAGYSPTIAVPVTDAHTVYRAVFIGAANASGVQTAVRLEGGAGEVPGSATGDKAYSDSAGAGQQTTLQAFPLSDQYMFSHWERSRDGGTAAQISTANPYAVKVENNKDIYTAVFVKAAEAKGVQTTVRLIGGAAGEGGTVTGDKVYSASAGAGQQTTLQAFPSDPSVVFAYWERSRDGGTAEQVSSANPYAVKVENHKDIYTAVFRSALDLGVFVSADPMHGTATGAKAYDWNGGIGQQTTLQAFPISNEWEFDHWELVRNGATPAVQVSIANPYTVPVTGTKDEYTAVFRAADSQGVFVEVSPTGGGTATGAKMFNPNGGAGQQTTLQAFPSSADWVFDHWELTRDNVAWPTNPVSTSNPYTVKVEDHKDVYTAVFRAADSQGVFVAVRLEGAAAGEVPGSATGDKTYNPSGGAGQQTTLQAFPASNAYIFTHWELSRNGGAATTASSANPYAVKVENRKDVYTAVFMKTPDNAPEPVIPEKTGITDTPFLDIWRKFTSPNYGTTRESMEEKAAGAVSESSDRLAGASSGTGGSAALAKLKEALSGKRADKTKERSEMTSLPEDVLVTSDGDIYITEDVGAGDYSDYANELVAKRFGSLYDYEILQMVRVSGPANQGGLDTTMVWRYTGAADKDRLILMRFLPDGTQSIATPVADEDGTLTFTLPAAADSEYMLLKVFLLKDVG